LDEVETERYHAELNEQDNEEVREMVITWEETIAASEASTLAENDPLVLARSDPHEDRVLAARSSSSSAAGAVIGTVWSSAVTTTIRLVV
jgi:hypothetical protein